MIDVAPTPSSKHSGAVRPPPATQANEHAPVESETKKAFLPTGTKAYALRGTTLI